MSEAVITAAPPMGMVVLRGALLEMRDVVSSVTGCAIPDQRLSTKSGDCQVMWMSPDELLIATGYDKARDLVTALTDAFTGHFATVLDVSDARAVFDISGAGAGDVITSLAPVDLAALAKTEVRRTRLAQIPVAFWRHSDGYRLICFRSVARYAEDVLRNAAGTHPITQRA